MTKCKVITAVSSIESNLLPWALTSNPTDAIPANAIPRSSAYGQLRMVADVEAVATLKRRDLLILEHLSLARIIALRMHHSVPTYVDLDDMTNAGVLGLIDAAAKFDATKQVGFSTYARHRIRGSILDSLRQLDWASRDVRRQHKEVEAATRDLTASLQRVPDEVETANKLGIGIERLRTILLNSRNVGLTSASTRGNESELLPAPDFPDTVQTRPDWICSQNVMRQTLGEAMKGLPERYQQVVEFYYTKDMTMQEIGAAMGINESRVSQIHKSALEKMATLLKKAGVTTSQAV